MSMFISYFWYLFQIRLGWLLVLWVRRKVVPSMFDLFRCTKGSFGILYNASRFMRVQTVRHCSQVLCSTRAAATPKALADRIASHRWDSGFVCSSKLQGLESGTGQKECGLEMWTVPRVCFVEYNENRFQASQGFNQFFRQCWPREMFELSRLWLCNLM